MDMPKKHSQKLNTLIIIVSSLSATALQLKPDLMTAVSPMVAIAVIGGLSALSAALVNYKQNL